MNTGNATDASTGRKKESLAIHLAGVDKWVTLGGAGGGGVGTVCYIVTANIENERHLEKAFKDKEKAIGYMNMISGAYNPDCDKNNLQRFKIIEIDLIF